jgi:tyrosine-protein kinase Etk/Wzc
VEDVLQRDAASGAYIIAAGVPVSSPADILQSSKMRIVLDTLSARFDAVILDSPPLLAVHDAGILARQADMTVMVVRWGATKETAVVAAMQRLHDLDVPLSGVILSMVDRKKYGRYGYPGEDILSDEMKKYYSS